MGLNFCGPKCSICCSLISLWGIIMLPIMGVLLKQKSLTFAEDLVEDIETKNFDDFIKESDLKYDNAAMTCFIAGAIYLASFAISAWQVFLNRRANKI